MIFAICAISFIFSSMFEVIFFFLNVRLVAREMSSSICSVFIALALSYVALHAIHVYDF